MIPNDRVNPRNITRSDHPRAFTLVELVTSLALMTILMAGIASAVVLAARAMDASGAATADSSIGSSPNAKTRDLHRAQVARVVDQLASELNTSLEIANRTASADAVALSFTVPDRDADGTAETLAYGWLSTDHQFRRYVNGQAVPVIDGLDTLYVESFALKYIPSSGETELAGFVPSTGSAVAFEISATNSCGQCFEVALPADVTSWSLTEAEFQMASKGPTSGETSVEIYLVDGLGWPAESPLDSVRLSESDLSDTFAWQTAKFDDLSDLPPTLTNFCLVFRHLSDAHSGQVLNVIGADTDPSRHYVFKTTGAWTWTTNSHVVIPFHVYGRTSNGLTDVCATMAIAAQADDQLESRIETTVELLNSR